MKRNESLNHYYCINNFSDPETLETASAMDSMIFYDISQQTANYAPQKRAHLRATLAPHLSPASGSLHVVCSLSSQSQNVS